MEIQDRIKKLSTCFKQLVVEQGSEGLTAYIVALFPDGWTIQPDVISEEYGVKVYKKESYYYFLLDDNGDFDNLFTSVEYTVKLNETLEEKRALFKKKANELKQLFASGDIEELKTLSFSTEKVTTKKGKKESADELDISAEDLLPEKPAKKGRGKKDKEDKEATPIKEQSDADLINELPD